MAARTWKPKTPEQRRRANLWSMYRIRPDDYDGLRESQGYRCAICARHEGDLPIQHGGRPRKDGTRATPTATPLVVDHDHKTGEVRGLLCRPCNTAIGMLEDCPDRLRGALRYLGEKALTA